MKTLIAVLATVAVLAGGMQKTAAGDREWATVGKVLTGVAAGVAIAGVIELAPGCAYSKPACYTPPPVVYVPSAPVVVYPAPVYVRSAPVVVYAPRPVISFRVGLGGRPVHRLHHRICR